MSLGRDTIITLGGKLPPAVGIFGRLRTLLDDADCDLDEIVELLRVDPALTFQLIKKPRISGVMLTCWRRWVSLRTSWRVPWRMPGSSLAALR